MTDPSNYHAFTDGTDTIIGTSLLDALSGIVVEREQMFGAFNLSDWSQVPDDEPKTLRDMGDGAEPVETRTIRQWIDWHIANNPDHFSRLLCSTEY